MIIEYLGGPMDGQRDNVGPPSDFDLPPLSPPSLYEIRYRATDRFTQDGLARIFEFVRFDHV